MLRQYIRTSLMGPVPDGIELLLISILPYISSSQGDARITQVPSSMCIIMLQRNFFACGLFYLIHYCSENTALQRLISAVYLFWFFFLYCLFMTVTQKLCSILIITIVSKRSLSITSTSISVFGPQDSI